MLTAVPSYQICALKLSLQRASASPSTAEPTGNDAADNEEFLCNPREDRTVWICLRHREAQFIFLGGVSFCQASRVQLRETIRPEFTFGLNLSKLKWKMRVQSVQLCFSKVHNPTGPTGSVTAPQKGILGVFPFPARGTGSAPNSALKFLRSVPCTLHIPRSGQGVPVCWSSSGQEQGPTSPLSDCAFGIIQALTVPRAEQGF